MKLNTASAIYLGDQAVDRVYAGSNLVWSPPWTPAAIPGLTAWFDASQDTFTDGQPIVTYVEHSPASRMFATQAGVEPVFRAGSGRPYLDLPHSNAGGFVSAAPWNPGTIGLTFVFVGRITGGSYPMMMVWGPDADGIEMRHDGSAQQIVVLYSSSGIYYSHSTPAEGNVDHLFTMRLSVPNGRSEAWTNAIKQTDNRSPAAMPNIAQPLYLGRRQGGYPFVGRVYEALAFAGAVSNNDLDLLWDFLRDKWL